METLLKLLNDLNIPFAYDHFAEGENPPPPFICYLIPKDNNFGADGIAYYKINEIRIELYTDKKNLSIEQRVESALSAISIFYNKSETWIDSEKLYEVLYQFEMEGINNA